MAGTWRLLFLSAPALLFGANQAHAFGECAGISYMPTMIVSYSYPWMPPSCCWPSSVVPITPRAIYANPVPAPPSKSAEPPSNKKQTKSDAKDGQRPVIIATRAPVGAGSAKELCRVGFWNLAGHDVTLAVEGKTWTVPKDRAITLDLPHDFSWQIDQRPAQAERVAEGQTTHEVVLR